MNKLKRRIRKSKDKFQKLLGSSNATPAASQTVSSVTPATFSVQNGFHPDATLSGVTHASNLDPNPTGGITVASSSWTGLRSFINVLGKAAGSFGPLRSVAEDLLSCVVSVEQATQHSRDVAQLQQTLNHLFSDISVYFNNSLSPPSMTPTIASFISCIEKEVEFLRIKERQPAIGRYFQASESTDELLECYRRIHMLVTRLSLNVNVNIWRILDEQTTDMRIKALPHSPSARFRSAESENLWRVGCVAHTRVDVLRQLHEWACGVDDPHVYWINGMAGTGKTTIAYSVCEMLKNTGNLAASFFCARQLPSCCDVNRIIPSIAYQLSIFSQPFRYAVAQILQEDPDLPHEALSEQFSNLIARPLNSIKQTLPEGLVVVIDALDECVNNNGVDHMLYALLEYAHQLPVKFLLTSRPEPLILDRMRQERTEQLRRELRLHELDTTVVQEDIKTYLIFTLGPHVNLSPTDLNALVERSGVLFIYAATVIRFIGRDNFSRGEDRLKQIINLSASRSANTVREMDVLYTTILEAALEDETLDTSEQAQIKTILHTVICAKEPLPVNVLAELLGVQNPKSVHAALRPLRSVIQITSSAGLVTTLHQSFPDFLFDKSRSNHYSCNSERQNGYIARLCHELIKAPSPPFNICHLESSYLLDSEVPDIEVRISKVISQGLWYACRYWPVHFESAGSLVDLTRELQEFASHRFLLWMEVMNLKGYSREGTGLLHGLHAWLKEVNCPKSIEEHILDCQKFAAAVASSPVSARTPHIYISTLPFWPANRPVSLSYWPKMSGLIKATGTAMSRRNAASFLVCTAKNMVKCVAYSPSGAQIASSSDDHNVHVWDAYTGQLVGQLCEGHDGWVNSIAFSPNGKFIASGSSDCTVRVWDTATMKPVGEALKGHTKRIWSVAYAPDAAYIVSGSDDHTIRIWSVQSRASVGPPLEGHSGWVLSVSFSPNGKYVVSGSADSTIRIWDVSTGHQVGQPLIGHAGSVRSVAYSPDGEHIASGSSDYTIRIWDLRTGQPHGQPLAGHTGWVNSVAYLPSGASIVSGAGDNTIRIWCAHTGKSLAQPLEGHQGWVNSISSSLDGTQIASGSTDQTIRVWDSRTGQTSQQDLEGSSGGVRSIAYSPDGAYIASGSQDHKIRIWDTRTARLVCPPLRGHTGYVSFIAYSPDGAHISSSSTDHTIRIWDARTGALVVEPLKAHTNKVWSVEYSPDGAFIASGSDDQTVRIWDARTGQPVGQPFKSHSLDVTSSVRYSPDGAHLISGSHDWAVRIWNVRTGQLAFPPLEGHTHRIWSVRYSPDGMYIASGAEDCTVRIWSARTGQPIGSPLQGHTRPVYSIAYSPDGAYIASGSTDHTIRIWDAQSGHLVGIPFKGHDEVWSVMWSPDGKYIASSFLDDTIRIWNAPGNKGASLQEARYISTPSETEIREDIIYHPVDHWTLDMDGWVIREGKHIMWIPNEMRTTLMPWQNVLAIGKKGWLELSFEDVNIGERWTRCYSSV